jgi:predicted secreted hydrolase
MRSNALLLLLILSMFASCTPKYIIDHSRPVRPINLPKDDAAHYAAQTEWWYYTGHLKADDGAEYGFEVTFFKRLTSEDFLPGSQIPGHWIKEVGMLGHFAVTDLEQKKFHAAEINNLAKKWTADPDRYHVSINGWSVEARDGSHLLTASADKYAVDLKLTPIKPAALNGPGGIVDKGVNANYYYSYTNMRVEGTMQANGRTKTVSGKAWMDHEFGAMGLLKSRIGWDWFSIQLENNTELMIYMIKENQTVISQSGGTYVDADGKTRWLKRSDIEINATDTWTSPKTKAVYPAAWVITIKALNLRLMVKPLMSDQELALKPVTYWEGAVTAAGTSGGKPASGRGYVELVGYDRESSFEKYK